MIEDIDGFVNHLEAPPANSGGGGGYCLCNCSCSPAATVNGFGDMSLTGWSLS